MELRKLIVTLRNEDKLSIRNISKDAKECKSVNYSISRKLEETESCEGKKLHDRLRKTTVREDGWISNESKKD